jgi:putative ABC transport system substrate-binding protein
MNPSETVELERLFWSAMSKRGWVRDENIVVERANVDELIRRRVEVILPIGQTQPVTAARATRTIPIVFFDNFFPLEEGLIESYARPGRNVTGITGSTGVEVSLKRVDFLRQVVPSAKRLSWIWPPQFFSLPTVSGDPTNMVPILEAAARKIGFETRFHPLREEQTLDELFGAVAAWRAEAVNAWLPPASPSTSRKFAELALLHRLPTAFFDREHVEAGALLSYGTAPSEFEPLVDRWAEYVDRILRGARPGDLPVEQPRRYELVINLKTARALGITIPQSLRVQAELIE